jgi:hypothetical protein
MRVRVKYISPSSCATITSGSTPKRQPIHTDTVGARPVLYLPIARARRHDAHQHSACSCAHSKGSSARRASAPHTRSAPHTLVHEGSSHCVLYQSSRPHSSSTSEGSPCPQRGLDHGSGSAGSHKQLSTRGLDHRSGSSRKGSITGVAQHRLARRWVRAARVGLRPRRRSCARTTRCQSAG